MIHRELESVATFCILSFNSKITEDGPLDAEANKRFNDVRRDSQSQQHWSVHWAQSVGQTHVAVLIIVQRVFLLLTEQRYDSAAIYHDDVAQLREFLLPLEPYLETPPRIVSAVLGKNTMFLGLQPGQALTLYLADVDVKSGWKLNRTNNTFEECDGPPAEYPPGSQHPLSQLRLPTSNGRSHRGPSCRYRSHREPTWIEGLHFWGHFRRERPSGNPSTELTNWYTGETVEAFLKGPRDGETQQHVIVADWLSIGAAHVYQDPQQSSARSRVPDDVWSQHFVRPIQDLKEKGVITNFESWTLDLQFPGKPGELVYQHWRESMEVEEALLRKDAMRRARNCHIM